MGIRTKVLVAALLSIAAWIPCNADDSAVVIDSSFTQPDGSRVLQQSIDVPASREEVWHAFTTADGLMSWAVPFAVVDFRLGGSWETSYQPNARSGDPANIRSRIISFLPMTMLSLQAEQAPPDFPNPNLLKKLFSVFLFESLSDERVRITVSGIGYGPTADFDTLYENFREANRWTLLRLHERFQDGPFQWDATNPTINNRE